MKSINQLITEQQSKQDTPAPSKRTKRAATTEPAPKASAKSPKSKSTKTAPVADKPRPRYFINRIQDELAEANAKLDEARKLREFLQSSSFTKKHPDGNVPAAEVLRRLEKIA